MSWDLPTLRGRPGVPTLLEVVRELTPEDLALLDAPRQTFSPLKDIRERHHALARILVSGATAHQASMLTGFTAVRVNQLQHDPAFRELLAHYRSVTTEEFVEQGGLWAGVTKDALVMLREQMEESPEEFSPAMLLKIATSGADRTGHGPTSNQTQNVNVTFGMAERMERARARLAESKVIDVTPETTDG